MASPWTTDKQLLRERLRAMREAKGVTQVQLAVRLGKPQSYVSKIESGDRNLDLFEVRTYCMACDTDFVGFVQALDEALQIGAGGRLWLGG